MVVHTIFRTGIPVFFFFFTYLTLPSERSFLLATVWTCALLSNVVPEGCLFPLIVDLLLFTEPLVWVACFLRAKSVQAPPGASRGAAGHCHTSQLSSKCQATIAAGRSGVKSRGLSGGQSQNLVQQVCARCKHGCDWGVALDVPRGQASSETNPELGGGFLTGLS